MRVGVQEARRLQQPAARAEVLDEVVVGVLDPAAGVRADPLVVGPVEADGVHDGQAVLLAEPEVVLAERDRGVHEAGAVVGGDEVAQQQHAGYPGDRKECFGNGMRLAGRRVEEADRLFGDGAVQDELGRVGVGRHLYVFNFKWHRRDRGVES